MSVPETMEEALALLEAEKKEKEAAVERAVGAEKVIEAHKKKGKGGTSEQSTFSKEDVEQMLADRDAKAKESNFYAKNPDLVEYKDKIAEYTSKGLSIEDAKVLLEKKDETIANRKNISMANFTQGDSGVTATKISQEQLSKMSLAEFKAVMARVKKGEVKIA